MTVKHSNYDLHGDVEKIKAALRLATKDAKGRAAEILTDSMQDIQDKTTQTRESIEEYTAEKPFKSLGIALFAGFILGLFMRR